jgi:S1-C subfamily serine protease
VAILRILDAIDEDLPIAVLGDSDRLEVGEWVIAIGSPFELDSSVSVGVVSAVGRTGVLRGLTPAEEFIQTDASLNPGNSGGPLINLDGQVVGINTAIQTGGMTRSSAGVGFAIPINLVRSIAASLIERGIARRGRLGVRFERTWVPAEELEERGIDAQRGIRVEYVEPDSPAAAAGLEKGDIITAVDGRPLKSIQILFARLTQAGPGGTLSLLVHGTAGTRIAEVTLGEAAVVTYGIEVADLAPSRASELGLPPDARGALVTKVKKGSKAAAGDRIMPGDVIVRVDWPGGRQLIGSRKDFVQVMAHLEQEAPRRVRLIFRTKDGLFETYIDP